MPDKIRMRRGNFANLPTLDDGEIGLTEDTKKLYIGTTTGNVQVAMATQELWTAPTLLNAWVNAGGAFIFAGYYKDNFGIVHLRGLIISGTATSGTILLNLPVGYRPIATEPFTTYSNDGLTIGTAIVTSAGDVKIISGTNAGFSLSGISFRTT